LGILRPDLGEDVSAIVARGLSPYPMLRPSMRKIVTVLEAGQESLAISGSRSANRWARARRSRLLAAVWNAPRASWARICAWANRGHRPPTG
jgi:hypothetical protein